jgi:hypothetical protein
VVECQLPKLDVAGSNPVSRSKNKGLIRFIVYDVTTITASARKNGVSGGCWQHFSGNPKPRLTESLTLRALPKNHYWRSRFSNFFIAFCFASNGVWV